MGESVHRAIKRARTARGINEAGNDWLQSLAVVVATKSCPDLETEVDSDLDGEALDEHDLLFIDALGDVMAVDVSAVHGSSATAHGLSASVDASTVDAEAASAVHGSSSTVHGLSATVDASIVDATSGHDSGSPSQFKLGSASSQYPHDPGCVLQCRH